MSKFYENSKLALNNLLNNRGDDVIGRCKLDVNGDDIIGRRRLDINSQELFLTKKSK
uniref:Uncharacterized protein n=1 Tax=viral metagenome TaxID=1070528 RepID=A0A6C0C999_9ZZZZ